jgi:phosphate-selective porin OprO and OprP
MLFLALPLALPLALQPHEALAQAQTQPRLQAPAQAPPFQFSLERGLVFTAFADGSGTGSKASIDTDSSAVESAAAPIAQLTLRFRIQNLVQAQTRSESNLEIDRIAWTVRRLRLRLNGFVLDPSLQFLMQLSMSRGDMDWDNTGFPNIIRDAMVFWRPNAAWQLGFGTGKLPGNRQRVVSSSEMQMIDRSIVNAAFNIDRDFGVHLVHNGNFSASAGANTSTQSGAQTSPMSTVGLAPDAFSYSIRAAVSTGDGRNNVVSNTGLSYALRAELLPFGAFTRGGDYFEGDLAREQSPKLSIAGGYCRNMRSQRVGGQIGLELFQERSMATILTDAVFKYNGLSVYGEWCSREALGDSPITSNASGDRRSVYDGTGVLVQAGYFLSEHLELVARFANTSPRASIQELVPQQTQYTAGANYYLNGHRIKLQADCSLDNLTNLASQTTTRSWIGRFQVEFGI